MPTAPLSAGHRSQHPPRRSHNRSTAGRRAVSTSRLDLLARPRSTLLHAPSASKSSTPFTPNAKSPQVTIPSNELRKSKDGGRARMSVSLTHLNKDPTAPKAAPKPSKPVTRRATTVGSGVATEKPSRPRRAPPAARSSGNAPKKPEKKQETLPRGDGVSVHAWCGLLATCMSGYLLFSLSLRLLPNHTSH